MIWTSVRVTLHIHATEDEHRVAIAVADMLAFPHERLSPQQLEGYHGNRIIRYHAHLLAEEASAVARRVFSGLGPRDRERIAADLPQRVDEHGHLFLRLDKQLMILGRWGLSDVDVVRVEFKPKLHPREHLVAETYRGLLV